MADTTPTSSSGGTTKTKPAKPGDVAPTISAGGIEVRDPDALQTGMIDVWGWVEANAKIIAGLIALALLVGVGFVISGWLSGRAEKKAQEAYYAVEAKFTKAKEGYDRAKYKAMMPAVAPAAGDDKSVDKPATGDLAKDYGTLVTDLETVAKDYPKTSAGAQAAILAGETYLSYNQPDKAVEIAQVPVKNLGDKSLLAALSRILWGNALVSKGDCREALKVWQPVLDSKAQTFLHGDVALRSGLCYENLNEVDKAREMYQKVTAEGAESPSASTAKGLLRALDVKSKAASAPAKQG